MNSKKIILNTDCCVEHFFSLFTTILKERNELNICLTGGTTAIKFYWQIFNNPIFKSHIKKCKFFITDERWVPFNSAYSNAGTICRLIKSIPNLEFNFTYFDTSNSSSIDALTKYSNLLPRFFDLLFLGIGLDGHIASLFQKEYKYCDLYKNVIFESNSPKYPRVRVSIAPPMISGARYTIVLAGSDKEPIADIYFSSNLSKSEYPMSIMNNPTWYFLD